MALVQTWCLETTIWNSEKSFYGPWSYKKRWIGLWGKLNFKAYISELDLYLNESRIRQRYRMHNAYVMATVPKGNDTNWLLMDSDCFIWVKALGFQTWLSCHIKDRLLVYNIKDGWKPLCDFLEKEIPSAPIPHDNRFDDQGSDSKARGLFMNTKLIQNRDATVKESSYSIQFILRNRWSSFERKRQWIIRSIQSDWKRRKKQHHIYKI